MGGSSASSEETAALGPGSKAEPGSLGRRPFQKDSSPTQSLGSTRSGENGPAGMLWPGVALKDLLGTLFLSQ